MFLHSQALQAHQQNQSSTTSHQETEPMETSTESTPQQQPSNLSTGPPLVTQHVSRQGAYAKNLYNIFTTVKLLLFFPLAKHIIIIMNNLTSTTCKYSMHILI